MPGALQEKRMAEQKTPMVLGLEYAGIRADAPLPGAP